MTDQAATIERLEQELGDARLASGEWQAAAAGLTRDLRMAEAVRDRLAAEVARLKREAAPAARITAAPSDLRVCGTCADLGGEIPLSVHSRECAAGHGAPCTCCTWRIRTTGRTRLARAPSGCSGPAPPGGGRRRRRPGRSPGPPRTSATACLPWPRASE